MANARTQPAFHASTYMTPSEAATVYKVTRQTIYRWIRGGFLRAVHKGRTVRILVVPAEHYPDTDTDTAELNPGLTYKSGTKANLSTPKPGQEATAIARSITGSGLGAKFKSKSRGGQRRGR